MQSVRINKITKQRLAKFGTKLDSWDKIINSILDHTESCDLWYYQRDEK